MRTWRQTAEDRTLVLCRSDSVKKAADKERLINLVAL